MRLMFWSESFWPTIGGAEVLAVHLLPALRERGYDSVVVTCQDSLEQPVESEFCGIPVHHFPFNQTLASTAARSGEGLKQTLAAGERLTRLKAAFKPDHAHAHFMGPGIFLHLRTQAAHRSSWSAALHNYLPPVSLRPDTLLGRALRAADWITTCSEAVLEATRRRMPEIAAKTSALSNALPFPKVLPAPLPFAPPRLLCLSRLVPEKGIDLAVEAAALLVGRFPNLRLTVAGNGPALPDLKQQAARLGLEQVVEFVGWMAPDKVPELINTATVLLVPSRWHEPFGVVALQAAQMGRPVVAANVGGLPEIVVHGETGLLFEKDEAFGLAEAVAYLLDHRIEASRMGPAGRRRAEARFNWTSYVDAHDEMFRRLALPRRAVA